MDNLSRAHFKAVRTEIEGRFFSAEEAAELKDVIEAHTVTDPQVRAAAAECWAPQKGDESSR